MQDTFSKLLGYSLLLGLIGFAVYIFAFGQTFEGEIGLQPKQDGPDVIGLVTFQSRFKNRRFLTHSVFLDLESGTPTTYRGERITAGDAVRRFSESEIEARVGYREDQSGWGKVVSLDLEPPGTSPKEFLLISALVLIFGSSIGLAVISSQE